jgi:hypothetical protein
VFLQCTVGLKVKLTSMGSDAGGLMYAYAGYHQVVTAPYTG